MRETAYAKINLALYVRRRREDGYHELETLFAFVDAGDELTVQRAAADRVTTLGPLAGGIDDPFDNLVAKALSVLPHDGGLDVTLEKNLPVAAGLGGGSADAGAVFRIIREMNGLPDDWRERATRLGADVPACVDSITCAGRGIGEELSPVENDLAGTPVLLLNDGTRMPTGPVFAAWDGLDRGPMPAGTAADIARAGRNDLEAPALSIAPQIGKVLELLRDGPTSLVRMSGSGATCYALYEDEAACAEHAAKIAGDRPDWWQMRGCLR
ncbi:4-(cytidine 5'-diphospho)-2-C-methyl-D-erythritol kinase [Alteriqipengyuania flavescens]|uniref:4-(cytidine 5'-diphospho)-2-C-methyl-D-erythritol kinase n=1 Tax=Alteriqipengyuania flavescens TaxID=3053610 RepID=UPI0025B288BA|nr:4-(cytidine 5'-diphospho)-2-C-methyl-D-erythritol kinase [Alteriqipengyuania flavescens]WJY18479.1 4-(cytidine 5'-diphospho)-2-C-methyl-D-erythritol kinase [Alteriqipengyuania flavescens]WJY24420.1 4-(cytidine 5'-diphospho)-2-C-methyl-D-erythritol kinase [Alteriqipengyuania flavescens]